METIMSDLLKEAIADAKAVRETALQNAKMALEEAFTPHLKSMLSAKLAEDDIEEDDNPFADDEEEDEEEAEDMAREEEGDEDPNPFADDDEESEPEMEEEGIIEINGVKYAPVVSEEDEEEEIDSDEEVEESEELDLEAVIKELEQEIAEADDSDDEDLTEGPKEDEEAEVKEEVEEITEEDEESDEDKDKTDEAHESVDDIQAELKEYKEAVAFLRNKLHEVNILNAKLLYTNKLFKEFVLSNNQKLKIVETFDRAQTAREIKLVYSTLAESYKDTGGSRKNNDVVREFASKKSGGTAPKTKIISEEVEVADRFKKLAGILND